MYPSSVKISIIGAGRVGSALAAAITKQDIPVTFGIRDTKKVRQQTGVLQDLINITSQNDAIALGDIIILAIPYDAALELATAVSDWDHKILVDATNRVGTSAARVTAANQRSAAEDIASRAQHARVVKAFNSVGAEILADPCQFSNPPFMPVCGDDEDARQTVLQLARGIGFDAQDLGDLGNAHHCESLARLWMHLALKQRMGRNIAFSLLR